MRRVDSSISKAYEDKMKLISSINHIPTTKQNTESEEAASPDSTPKDAKELVVVCIQKGLP